MALALSLALCHGVLLVVAVAATPLVPLAVAAVHCCQAWHGARSNQPALRR